MPALQLANKRHGYTLQGSPYAQPSGPGWDKTAAADLDQRFGHLHVRDTHHAAVCGVESSKWFALCPIGM